jgi:hypothetical protein
MYKMADTQQFSIWVTQLGGRVKYLQESTSYKKAEEIEREANTCRAELSHLYDYARQHSIDINPYYFQLQDIESRLRLVEDQIKRKQYAASSSERPWWQRVLNFVIQAINFVSSLLGLGSLFPRLPGSDYPKLPK